MRRLFNELCEDGKNVIDVMYLQQNIREVEVVHGPGKEMIKTEVVVPVVEVGCKSAGVDKVIYMTANDSGQFRRLCMFRFRRPNL